MQDKQIRLKVFQQLCHCDLEIMYGWVPTPTTVIARILGISLYRCRKAMNQLVQEGLAVSAATVVDYEESPLPYRGYHVTEKGKKTGIYLYCALKEARKYAKCFDANVASFLPKDFDERWLNAEEYADWHTWNTLPKWEVAV